MTELLDIKKGNRFDEYYQFEYDNKPKDEKSNYNLVREINYIHQIIVDGEHREFLTMLFWDYERAKIRKSTNFPIYWMDFPEEKSPQERFGDMDSGIKQKIMETLSSEARSLLKEGLEITTVIEDITH